MLDKYVKVEDRPIVSGQDGKTGYWYCKELVTRTTKETKDRIGELNKIYNDHNKETKQKQKNQSEKQDGPKTETKPSQLIPRV